MTRSFADELANSEAPIVVEAKESPVALVTFGGIAEQPGMPPAEFANVTDGLAATRIFVRDRCRAFYHLGVPGIAQDFHSLASAVRDLTGSARRVVLVGNSAGATAALIVGGLMRADQVLAFAPITIFGRWQRLALGDRRWGAHVRKFNRRPFPQPDYIDVAAGLRRHPPLSADVYFAQGMRLDALHARRLENISGVRLRPVPGKSHAVIRELRDSGELRRLLAEAVAGA